MRQANLQRSAWFEWPVCRFGATEVRLFHVVMMWLLILFVPAHNYLVNHADEYARAGSLSAMISGGRWVRRGARFEDD
jgi:Ni,Fe-hydrogenase I cytochrome b subunit